MMQTELRFQECWKLVSRLSSALVKGATLVHRLPCHSRVRHQQIALVVSTLRAYLKALEEEVSLLDADN
jgi:hypothetical protein